MKYKEYLIPILLIFIFAALIFLGISILTLSNTLSHFYELFESIAGSL